jgi:hypothetical protein
VDRQQIPFRLSGQHREVACAMSREAPLNHHSGYPKLPTRSACSRHWLTDSIALPRSPKKSPPVPG